MNLLLCMQFFVLIGGSYADGMSDNCSLTLDGYTWQFDPALDEAIPGIGSTDACAEECLALDWCVGYTWSLDDSAGTMCYLFHQLNDLHPCNNCSECISGKFNPITGVCNPKNAEDIIAVKDADSELACVELCAATPGCNHYSWSCNGTIFTNKCFLFKECCNPAESCEYWQSGDMTCFEQQHNDQCNNYKILNDKHRNRLNGAHPLKCDMSSAINISPDWQGHNWYRILPPAGTQIATSSPGFPHCGSDGIGFFNGNFPDFSHIGQTLLATVMFKHQSYPYLYQEINATLCADAESKYFVYQLPNTPHCSIKYCAE